ncbi:hypothetical protein ACLMJK_002326 [Lecanora helva]
MTILRKKNREANLTLVQNNPRFASYCPFCQISTGPSALPSQGLRDPPAYSPPPSPRPAHASLALPPEQGDPPAYSAKDTLRSTEKKQSLEPPAEDVLHFLDPSQDTISSLSLRYGVPQDALRRKNGLFADHLLAARRTLLIPGEFYKGGVSLSPEPIEDEEEEIRKTKVRRWMVACKVAEREADQWSSVPVQLRYDIAVLYLQQANYNLDLAVETYLADEKWGREHPMERSSQSKKAQKPSRHKVGIRTGLSGQL